MNLLETVISALNERKGNWPSIASDNGVSYSWLTKLAQGKIPNPGIQTVERLYHYLLPDQAKRDRRVSSDRRANRRGGN
jgi:predicted transcriptional regulator